jgi:hypothetical protein
MTVSLPDLLPEILDIICDFCNNKSIKNLSETCSLFYIITNKNRKIRKESVISKIKDVLENTDVSVIYDPPDGGWDLDEEYEGDPDWEEFDLDIANQGVWEQTIEMYNNSHGPGTTIVIDDNEYFKVMFFDS